MTVRELLDSDYYVIADRNDNQLIGVDERSGGYPWKPSSLNGVKIWANREDAERYVSHSFGEDYEILSLVVAVDRLS
jgi:hypothetical protein